MSSEWPALAGQKRAPSHHSNTKIISSGNTLDHKSSKSGQTNSSILSKSSGDINDWSIALRGFTREWGVGQWRRQGELEGGRIHLWHWKNMELGTSLLLYAQPTQAKTAVVWIHQQFIWLLSFTEVHMLSDQNCSLFDLNLKLQFYTEAIFSLPTNSLWSMEAKTRKVLARAKLDTK